LQQLLNKALQTTNTDWKTLVCVYGWVHQLAQVLDDAKDCSVEERQLGFQIVLLHMQKYAPEFSTSWQKALAHFLKVTQSSASHLFSVIKYLIFHGRTMTWNNPLAVYGTMNDERLDDVEHFHG
jgi:hypothetical protein